MSRIVGQIISVLVMLLSCVGGAAASEGLNVLLVSSFTKDLPAQVALERGLDAALGLRAGRNSLFVEFLDNPRLPIADSEPAMVDLLARKYAGIRIDAVVAWGNPAARVVAARRDLFRDAPIFYVELSGTDLDAVGRDGGQNRVFAARADTPGTIREALRLSGARRIAVISETGSVTSRIRLDTFRESLAKVAPELPVEELYDLPLDALMDRVARLPEGTILYYLLLFSDGHGHKLTPYDAAQRITARANVPMFSAWGSLMGSGIVGGYLFSQEVIGFNVGTAIMTDRQGQAVRDEGTMRHVYDWQQLKRWGWDEAALPDGAAVLYRQPDLFSQYRWYITGAGVFMVALSLLTLVLARAVASRNEALQALALERRLLADRVAERTEKLTLQARELERSNLELERFAYAISHDLRTPVRHVVMFSQMLQKNTDWRPEGEAADFLGYIVAAGHAMDSMILGVLEVSRAGRLTPESFEDQDVARIAEQVAALLREGLQDGEVTVEAPPDLPHGRVNAEMVRRLFQNLIDNALKYRSPDRSPRVRVRLAAEDGRIAVAVHDNGLGIPEAKREVIFGLFQRDAPPGVAGYGIGLALCQRIVETHGGRLWVEDEPGGGSCFRFSLPTMVA